MLFSNYVDLIMCFPKHCLEIWTNFILFVVRNNAGVMATPYTLSKDKIELQFATNHLGMNIDEV